MSRTLSCAEIVVGAICVLIVAAILFPVLGSQPHSHRSPCLSNMKQAVVAQLVYAEENDHRFPDAAGWIDLTLAYSKSLSVYHCPELPKGEFGYAMHDAMSRVKQPPTEIAEKTLLLFESSDTTKNAHGGLAIYTSPGRHKEMSFVAYADGHARSIPPGKRP